MHKPSAANRTNVNPFKPNPQPTRNTYNPQPPRNAQPLRNAYNPTRIRKHSSQNREEENHPRQVSSIKTSRNQSQIQVPPKSTLDRYSRRSTSASSHLSIYARAPQGQFKKYLDDSENVFWENSSEVKSLRVLKYLKYSLLILILALMGSYWLIGRLQPYPKEECPHNAECGVFIHCKKGYVLEGKRCVIDPKLRYLAESTCLAVVEQLQLDFGNQDCQPKDESLPKVKIRDVLDQFDIKDPLLQEGIYQFFQNQQSQIDNGFNMSVFTVRPTRKLHSLSCQFQIFTESPLFYLLAALLVTASIGGGYLVRWIQFRSKARRAYEYLKDRTLASDCLLIEEEKAAVVALVKEWNDPMWEQIDRLRCEDRRIVYYCEHEQLYWKVFQEL